MNKEETLFQSILIRLKAANSVEELIAIWPDVEKLPVPSLHLLASQAFLSRHIGIRLDALEKAVFYK